MLTSAELKGCVTWGITVPSFIIVGYVWQILGRVGPFCPPPPPIYEQLLKYPFWTGLKQKLKFEFYFFLKKTENRWKDWFFKGHLNNVTDQISTREQKKIWKKKRTEIHFSIFIENRNWDLKFVFWFDNKDENHKNFKIRYHLNTTIKCPFWLTDFL